jgi:chromosomal replication initiator protein
LLNRVVVYASMAGQKPLSLDLTKEALKELLSKDNKPITPTEIMRVVAAHYGTTVTNLKSKSNAQTVAFPRQVAMYLCKHLTDLSYPEIGRVFNNKHHSTVMYSVEKIDEKMQNDPQFGRVVEGLMKQFR